MPVAPLKGAWGTAVLLRDLLVPPKERLEGQGEEMEDSTTEPPTRSS